MEETFSKDSRVFYYGRLGTIVTILSLLKIRNNLSVSSLEIELWYHGAEILDSCNYWIIIKSYACSPCKSAISNFSEPDRIIYDYDPVGYIGNYLIIKNAKISS
jgi:hypothetical protein